MISLVTCTGDRPECFARCERWMARQTYQQGWQWIVVDDGVVPTKVRGGQRYIRLKPGLPPNESFKFNLRTGLEEATADYIFVIEDDDWYRPDHVHRLFSRLMDYDVVGESRAKYYHVGQRRYRQLDNKHHASLCQTAFTRKMTPLILDNLSETAFVDIRLWSKAKHKFLFPASESCVGLKGQKGRGGIGMGHHPRQNWSDDPDGTVLREWIGDDATEVLSDGS